MATKNTDKKTRRPTALKRDIQNEKRKLVNKVFKSKVRTAMRAFELALTANDSDNLNACLNSVYALMDKGVKRGIYKLNKASRVKSRCIAKVKAL